LGALPEVCTARLVEGDTFTALNAGLEPCWRYSTIRVNLYSFPSERTSIAEPSDVLEDLEIIGTGKA